jgi:hypothetical protein
MASYLPPINLLANTIGKIVLTNNVDFFGRDEIGDRATGQHINTLGGNDQTWLYASNMVVDHGDGDDSAWARFYNYAGDAVTNAAYLGGAGDDDFTLVANANDFMSGLYKLSSVNDATYGQMYQVTDNNNNKIYFNDFEHIKLSGSGSSYTMNEFADAFLNKCPLPAPPVSPPSPTPIPPGQLVPTNCTPVPPTTAAPQCPSPEDPIPTVEPPPVCYEPDNTDLDMNNDSLLEAPCKPVSSNKSNYFGPLRIQNRYGDYEPPYARTKVCHTNSYNLPQPTAAYKNNGRCAPNYGGFQSFFPFLKGLFSSHSQAPQLRGYAPVFNFNFNFGTHPASYSMPARNTQFTVTPWY